MAQRLADAGVGGSVEGFDNAVSRVRRLVLLALALLAVLAVAAPAAQAVDLGISDSDATTFTEPYWSGLNVNRARIVVPYDVATTTGTAGLARQRNFNDYLTNAAARGVAVEVTFGPSADVLAPGTNYPVAPSAQQFATAFAAFRQRYPQMTTIAPWNEPNNTDATGYPLGQSPQLAADYWLQAQAICPSCTVIAGDFAGIAGDEAYVNAYQAELGGARPAIWAFHAHGDINGFQADGPDDARVTRYYLSKLQGQWGASQIWIDEVGARFRDASSVIWGDASQQQSTEFLLGLATLDPRISAIYYYNYSNQCSTAARCAIQDRGLVSPTPFSGESPGYDATNRPRAAYGVIAARGPVIPPAFPVPPAVTIDTPAQSSDLRNNRPTFSGQAATGGRAEPTVTLQIFPSAGSSEGSTPVLTATAPVVGLGWSLTTTPLPDGTYTAEAVQVGNSRSAGTSQDVVFTIDTVPPTSTLSGAPTAPTGARTAKLTFTASEPGSTFRCSIDRAVSVPCTSPLMLSRLAVGRHSVGIRATDAAGNPQVTPTKVSWRIVSLATAVAPRRGDFSSTFRRGLPLAAVCADACRLEARLYAPRAAARAAGLAGRRLSRGDPARPAGAGGYLVVASGRVVRTGYGSAALELRLRASSAAVAGKAKGVKLRLGLVLTAHDSKPTAVSRLVTLTRSGGLKALATGGLPVTVVCSSACSGRAGLWLTRTAAVALKTPGGSAAGGGRTGLPGGRYVSLDSAAITRTSGGASDLVLRVPTAIRARIAKLRLLGMRVTAPLQGPGSPVRPASWPLTLGR